MSEEREVKVSEVLQMLTDGKTRADIREAYNLSAKQLGLLFQHPALKNKKTIVPVSLPFTLVDDTATATNGISGDVVGMDEAPVAATRRGRGAAATQEAAVTEATGAEQSPLSAEVSPVVEAEPETAVAEELPPPVEERPSWNR